LYDSLPTSGSTGERLRRSGETVLPSYSFLVHRRDFGSRFRSDQLINPRQARKDRCKVITAPWWEDARLAVTLGNPPRRALRFVAVRHQIIQCA
jgi:hypothetical protein